MKRMYMKLGALCTILLAIALLAVPVVARAQEDEEEVFGLDPVQEVVAPGNVVTFIGYGFGGVEQVRTWATSPFGEVFEGESAVSFIDGVVFFSFQVPDDADLGIWAMTARGDNTFRDIITTFEVVSPQFIDTPAPSAGAARIIPSFPDVEAGGFLDFVVSGFQNREGIEGWATDPTGVSFGGGFTYADSQGGRGLMTFFPPEDAINGYWTMTARGEKSALQVSTSFLVFNGVDVANAQPYLTVRPDAAPPGATFTFAARGFDAGEQISYSISGPGTTTTVLHGPIADMNGEIVIEWIAPSNAFPGPWSMSLLGLSSGHWLGIGFEVMSGG